MAIMSVVEKKKVIFVDFFDTIMHRHIHPLSVIARARKVSKSNGDNYLPILKCAEIGCQYPNLKLIKKLKNFKNNGKRIYIVSDFQMGKDDYIDFLKAKNIDISLFDDIFVSCECGCSKSEGGLYSYVLQKIGADATDVLMIGDNKDVDGKNAKRYGIDSLIIPHYWKKALNQVKRFLNFDYSRIAARTIRRDLYHYGSPYSEYSILFYLSTRELYKQLYDRGQKNVVFLAREGHFLKRAFDSYQRFFKDKNNSIETSYLKCSRRAAQSLIPSALKELENRQISICDYLMAHGFSKDEIDDISKKFDIQGDIHENTYLNQNPAYLRLLSSQSYNELIEKKRAANIKAGKQYFDTFNYGKTLNLVDIGWRGCMQDTIGKILDKNVEGYYVGLNDSELDLNNRVGLLFSSCPNQGVYSPWSQILKANIQLYEQLTAAPHGSAVGYSLNGGEPIVIEDWVENEKKLYYEKIESKQEELILNILGLAAWCEEKEYKVLLRLCAKTVLRSGLFADSNRLAFLKSLDEGFVWNFDKQTKGIKYKTNDVKVRKDIILSPEKYTRYVVKIQRSVNDKGKFAMALYYPFAILIYGYIWFINCLKN